MRGSTNGVPDAPRFRSPSLAREMCYPRDQLHVDVMVLVRDVLGYSKNELPPWSVTSFWIGVVAGSQHRHDFVGRRVPEPRLLAWAVTNALSGKLDAPHLCLRRLRHTRCKLGGASPRRHVQGPPPGTPPTATAASHRSGATRGARARNRSVRVPPPRCALRRRTTAPPVPSGSASAPAGHVRPTRLARRSQPQTVPTATSSRSPGGSCQGVSDERFLESCAWRWVSTWHPVDLARGRGEVGPSRGRKPAVVTLPLGKLVQVLRKWRSSAPGIGAQVRPEYALQSTRSPSTVDVDQARRRTEPNIRLKFLQNPKVEQNLLN